MGVGRGNVLASYLGMGGCREECVSLVPTCRWVPVGDMCYLLPRCGCVSGG